MNYEKLSLGTHEFLEPDGFLTLGQLQVSEQLPNCFILCNLS